MSNKQSSIDWIIELLEEYGIDIDVLKKDLNKKGFDFDRGIAP